MMIYTGIFLLVGIMNSAYNAVEESRRNQMINFDNEKRRLKIIMATFGFSYLLRGVASLTEGLYKTA